MKQVKNVMSQTFLCSERKLKGISFFYLKIFIIRESLVLIMTSDHFKY